MSKKKVSFNTKPSSTENKNEESSSITPLPDVVKGKADWRTYRPLSITSNGITCLLVHDSKSKTTAMSVAIGSGASSDPRSLSGLAHFVEHMCFLGSEKYPGENEYKRYLSSHGGRSNASTSMSFTTFQFDVLSSNAERAVDIFSNFFVSPLFTESGTGREVNAVDSENSKNLTSDGRRRLQILKAIADQEHHYSKFSTGNAKTLSMEGGDEEVREALLAFHRRHYGPDNMTVVIVGPQSLDEMQDWIIPRFRPIRSRWDPNKRFTPAEALIHKTADDAPPLRQPVLFNPAFRPSLQNNTWPIQLTTLPLRSKRSLLLFFPLPSDWTHPDRSPIRLISHLLGHEGAGSAFAVLQDLGYLNSLSAGCRVSAPDQVLFQVDVNLTETGEEAWKDVVAVLFGYCGLISRTASEALEANKNNKNNHGISGSLSDLQRIWMELIQLRTMNFHQTSPGNAYNLAPSLARSVAMYGTKDCMSAGSMLGETKDTLPLEDLLDIAKRLVPENCIVERCSKKAWEEQQHFWSNDHDSTSHFFGLKTEQWYDIDYYLSKIHQDDVLAWKPNKENGSLHLPTPNRYIPRTLDLCQDLPEEARHGPRIEKEIDPPKLLLSNPGIGRLWHRLDDRYALPKASLILLLRNAAVENTLDPQHDNTWSLDIDTSIQSAILMGAFSDASAQDTYDADLAGLSWSLSKSSSGLTLDCHGYSDRLADLALKLLADFFLRPSSFLQESYFISSKDRLVRNLESYFRSRRADSHAVYYRDLLTSSRGQGVDASLRAAKSVTLDDLKHHHGRILGDHTMDMECLYTGNVSEGEAKAFFQEACKLIKETCGNVRRKDDVSWVPGPYERRLQPGQDIELHFPSENPEEENGAVLVTFQSQVPGFKGRTSSSSESLKYTSAIRLICHMLREPLFDDLRTKQQLGYLVSSYYDISFVSRPHDLLRKAHQHGIIGPATTPIDTIVINILSRKASPPQVMARIDEFLIKFRQFLLTTPASEIKDHREALHTKLLKPIQKLRTESSMHFGKIRRYGPEVFSRPQPKEDDLPWTSIELLAKSIRTLEREDLIEVWDQVVADDKRRSKVVSCVYGKTFPLDTSSIQTVATSTMASSFFGFANSIFGFGKTKPVVLNTLGGLLSKRRELVAYDPYFGMKKRGFFSGFSSMFLGRRRAAVGIAAATFIGTGIIGFAFSGRGDVRKSGGGFFDRRF